MFDKSESEEIGTAELFSEDFQQSFSESRSIYSSSSGESQRSVSSLRAIFEPPIETSTIIVLPIDQGRQVKITSDTLPIDTKVALLKEEVLTKFYYGKADVSAGDFIDANLISILDTQLLEEHKSAAEAKDLVYKYMANYVNWASLAQIHSVKAANKVRNS